MVLNKQKKQPYNLEYKLVIIFIFKLVGQKDRDLHLVSNVSRDLI